MGSRSKTGRENLWERKACLSCFLSSNRQNAGGRESKRGEQTHTAQSSKAHIMDGQKQQTWRLFAASASTDEKKGRDQWRILGSRIQGANLLLESSRISWTKDFSMC